MNISRYMSTEMIWLRVPPPEAPPENPDLNMEKFRQRQKENLIADFVELLAKSGRVSHIRRLCTDMVNRERKASTALESGIAIPHVRTMHVRDTLIGFARSFEGIDFESYDHQPSHLFFIIASPTFTGDLHLKIYRQIITMFSFGGIFEELMAIEHPGEVIRIMRQFD